MTVLNGDGLVGRVKTVGPSTATVLLAVDPESSVGVRLEGIDGGRLHHRPRRRDARPATCELLDGAGDGRRAATGWSPSARRATRRTCPGCRSASVVVGRRGTPGLADPVGHRARRTSTSPRSTSSASSSSRRATDPRDAVLPPRPAVDADPDGHRHGDPEPGRRRRLTCPPPGSLLAVVLLLVALAAPGHRAAPAAAARRDPRPGAARRRRAGARPRAGLRRWCAASRPAWPPTWCRRPTTRSGRWALVLTLVGYLAGLARDQTRRSAFVPLVVVAVAGAGSVLAVRRAGRPDRTTRT